MRFSSVSLFPSVSVISFFIFDIFCSFYLLVFSSVSLLSLSFSFFLSTELSFSDTREYQKYYSKNKSLARAL